MYNLIKWPLQRNTASYDYAVDVVHSVDVEPCFLLLVDPGLSALIDAFV